MTREKTKTKNRFRKATWSKLDHRLFRLNLAIYQADPGKPPESPKAVELQQFKKAS